MYDVGLFKVLNKGIRRAAGHYRVLTAGIFVKVGEAFGDDLHNTRVLQQPATCG